MTFNKHKKPYRQEQKPRKKEEFLDYFKGRNIEVRYDDVNGAIRRLKKVLEKIIKPRIREIGDGSIHSISFKRATDDLYPKVKIIFKT